MIPTRKLIETANDDARFYRRRSDAQFGRKFSDGNILCFNSNLKKRTSSFSDYPRRLSVKSDQDFRKFSSGSIDVFYQSRRYSRDDAMEAQGFTKSKVYPITERKILENVDGLYLSKSKLMKTRSTNNIILPPLNLRLPKTTRKPQKPNGKSLRRVRSENYVIPLPFKNKILVSLYGLFFLVIKKALTIKKHYDVHFESVTLVLQMYTVGVTLYILHALYKCKYKVTSKIYRKFCVLHSPKKIYSMTYICKFHVSNLTGIYGYQIFSSA